MVQRLAVQQAVFLALALALALVLVLGRAAGLEVQGVGWQVLQEHDTELYFFVCVPECIFWDVDKVKWFTDLGMPGHTHPALRDPQCRLRTTRGVTL